MGVKPLLLVTLLACHLELLSQKLLPLGIGLDNLFSHDIILLFHGMQFDLPFLCLEHCYQPQQGIVTMVLFILRPLLFFVDMLQILCFS